MIKIIHEELVEPVWYCSHCGKPNHRANTHCYHCGETKVAQGYVIHRGKNNGF